jgi:hypothetical protein
MSPRTFASPIRGLKHEFKAPGLEPFLFPDFKENEKA